MWETNSLKFYDPPDIILNGQLLIDRRDWFFVYITSRDHKNNNPRDEYILLYPEDYFLQLL